MPIKDKSGQYRYTRRPNVHTTCNDVMKISSNCELINKNKMVNITSWSLHPKQYKFAIK